MTTTHSSLTVRCKVHFTQARRGRKEMVVGDALPRVIEPIGRVPRISRLMALAIRIEHLIATGEVRDYAEVAALGQVSRARATQIVNLTCLAPDLQEAILFLPPVIEGREPIKEWMVRPIAAEPDWQEQRQTWNVLYKT